MEWVFNNGAGCKKINESMSKEVKWQNEKLQTEVTILIILNDRWMNIIARAGSV